MNFVRAGIRGLPLVLLALAGCGGAPVEPGPVWLNDLAGGASTVRSDPAMIVEAGVSGDRLRLRVQFGGGCADHTFALRQSGIFRESYPVQTDLRLLHDAHGDPCRAVVAREIEFDLTPLRDAYRRSYATPSGTIALFLYPPADERAYPTTLLYTF